MTTNQTDIEGIKRELREAMKGTTPGPWLYDGTDGELLGVGPKIPVVADIPEPELDEQLANGLLIQKAVNALPALLADHDLKVKQLQAAMDALQAARAVIEMLSDNPGVRHVVPYTWAAMEKFLARYPERTEG